MRPQPPIYREHGRTYQADTCRPVARSANEGAIEYRALVRGRYPGRRLPRQGLEGIQNIGFWNIETSQPWSLDWHRNEGIEITFLERGRLPFSVEDCEYQLRPGDLTFARPWQRHRLGHPAMGPSRLHWLILDVGVRRPHQPWRWPPWLVLLPGDREELTTKLRQVTQPVWHSGEELMRCFQKIAAAIRGDHDGRNLSRLTAHLNELFVLLLELLRGETLSFDQSLSSAGQTVDLFWKDLRRNTHALAQPWTLPLMAERCGMGVTHFCHLTKELNNLSPMEALSGIRIEAAAKMLVGRPEMHITEVGMACGFGSSQYFAKVFRGVMRCTPSAYRQGHRRATRL